MQSLMIMNDVLLGTNHLEGPSPSWTVTVTVTVTNSGRVTGSAPRALRRASAVKVSPGLARNLG